jgi:transmembrane sensor
VVGTEFNVRKTEDATVVSVLQGQVEVTPESAGKRAAPVQLAAGEEASMGQVGVSPVNQFDPATVIAWQRGQVVFYRSLLAEVVAELNRYHRGQIVILSNHLRTLRVTGIFDTVRPTDAIDVIERTLHVKVTRLTDYLIFLH